MVFTCDMHTATLLPDGRVLVAGGISGSGYLSSLELYDPVAGTWAAANTLGSARSLHTATLLADATVLIAGCVHRGGPSRQHRIVRSVGSLMQRYGLPRSGNSLEVPPGEYRVRLILPLDADQYPRYRVRLDGAEGKSGGFLDGLKTDPGVREVIAEFPSTLIVTGDYILRLSGVAPDGSVEEINAFTFRIIKRQ